MENVKSQKFLVHAFNKLLWAISPGCVRNLGTLLGWVCACVRFVCEWRFLSYWRGRASCLEPNENRLRCKPQATCTDWLSRKREAEGRRRRAESSSRGRGLQREEGGRREHRERLTLRSALGKSQRFKRRLCLQPRPQDVPHTRCGDPSTCLRQ